MPMSKKSTSSLLTIPEHTRTAAPAALDPAAARALAWLARGEPQDDIVYDEAAPRQTPEELAAFRKAGYRKAKPRRP
jgi:hypothetical protein